MPIEPFFQNFRSLSIVSIYDDWEKCEIQSEWKGSTAVGCANYGEFHKNPQFFINVTKDTPMIIYLQQQDLRGVSEERQPTAIGFKMYKNDKKRIGKNDVHSDVLDSGSYDHERDIKVNFDKIKAYDSYTIIPSTFQPKEMSFKLTIYSKQKVTLKEAN